MSAIAARVGGSKTTLWACFPAKEDLFAAVVDDIVEQFGEALTVEFDAALPLETSLRHFGRAMMATVLSEPIIALHRVVIAEAGRFPELGAMFYARGPKRGRIILSSFLAQAMAAGRLRPGDPVAAARQFAALCQANSFHEALYGLTPARDDDAIAGDVDVAIATFVAAWRPEVSSR